MEVLGNVMATVARAQYQGSSALPGRAMGVFLGMDRGACEISKTLNIIRQIRDTTDACSHDNMSWLQCSLSTL